ncbi:hypothetical protein M404DRAFT_368915 [Pisolithus tinctorius Marx 270]|uniref:Uncharacterized protein n=1 Tax=Pisolithus tinctorius Marx 270 TaxID=870435 RepID=A0A0C3JB56_PISTI|nr:hypothetical protein M404DRAFT_368915 [Pisolithus tinctorius Marx 270]
MTHYNTRHATGEFPRVMWGRYMRLDMSVTDWTGMSQKVDYCRLPLAYPTNITLGNVARQTPYCTVCWMRSCFGIGCTEHWKDFSLSTPVGFTIIRLFHA